MSLDQQITISRNAASEPPSKLGLRSGQTIQLRYLIRAAAVKSANDAATALGEAVSGSEAEFARYMTSAAQQMGMTNTSFRNAHGLTANGHMSTARDMATLGRRLFYDFPDYYNLFSRISTETTVRTVYNTNRRFLGAYEGADGIKTGYTNAAGFNLVASARRGNERIIAAMFGGTSTAQRNGQVAKLLDMGFSRAPTRVAVIRPPRVYLTRPGAAPTVRVSGLVRSTKRPIPRGGAFTNSPSLVLMTRNIDALVTTAIADQTSVTTDERADEIAAAIVAVAPANQPPTPARRPSNLQSIAPTVQTASLVPATVVNLTPPHEFGDWSVQLGTYGNRTNTEKLLLRTALMDLDSLEGAERKVDVTQVQGITMYRARFVGLSEADAAKACERLLSRASNCEIIQPGA